MNKTLVRKRLLWAVLAVCLAATSYGASWTHTATDWTLINVATVEATEKLYLDFGGTGSEAQIDFAGVAGNSSMRLKANNDSGQYDAIEILVPASPGSGASVSAVKFTAPQSSPGTSRARRPAASSSSSGTTPTRDGTLTEPRSFTRRTTSPSLQWTAQGTSAPRALSTALAAPSSSRPLILLGTGFRSRRRAL